MNARFCIKPIPTLSNYPISLYPEVNIANGSIVNYSTKSFNARNGNKTNCYWGISKPSTADINGILKVRCATGIFWDSITPFIIWHWGTVGDMNGSKTPFANFWEKRFVNPVRLFVFAIW